MLGLTALEHLVHPETTWAKFMFIVENLPNMNKNTAAISFGALFVLIFLRTAKRRFVKYWWIYRVPEVLVVVVLSTVLSAQLRWDQDGVDILGAVNVSTGSSFLRFPFRSSNVRYLRRTTSTAVMISVIGYLDSIVAAKQSGARFGYSISPNRELVALGASNIVGSFIPGTLPAYGSITRYSYCSFPPCGTKLLPEPRSTETWVAVRKWHPLSALVSFSSLRFISFHSFTSCLNVSWLRCKLLACYI